MRNQKGQLLVEILLMIGVVTIVVGLGAQTITVATRSNKDSGQRNAAQGLVDETFEAVRAVSTESWTKIYADLTKNANYYPEQSSGAFVLIAGIDSASLSSVTYARTFMVQNVCRDTTTRTITGISDTNGTATTCASSGGDEDPSTQKVTVTVTLASGAPLSSSEYIERWRNKVCNQTSWSSTSTDAVSCPSGQYETKTDINIIDAGGSLTL